MPRSGTGRVYRRGDVWWVDYSHRGKRYRESSESTKKKDAVDLLKKRMAEQGQGRVIGPVAERVTFDDLAKGLANHYRIEGLRTWDRAAQSVAHLRDYFGAETRALDITKAKIAAYVTERLDDGAAPATVKRELAALSKMFNLALVKNDGPLPSAPAMPELRVNNVRTGFIDGADLETVIQELPDPLQKVVRFASFTGWRRGEVLKLTWAQVDFDAGVIVLDVGTTKNRKGRMFPFVVLPPLVELLEAQREHTRAIEKETGRIVTHVFHRRGEPIRSMRRAWKGACKRAGTTGRIVHDLRRTAARNLIRAGVDEKTAMTLLGHRTRSIFDRYNIVDDADQRAAIEKLATHLAGRPVAPRTVIPIGRAAEG